MAISDDVDSLELDAPASNLRIDDMLTCRSYAESGLGIPLLPQFIHSYANSVSRLVRVLPAMRSQEFNVQFIYPRQSFVPQTVRSFMKLAIRSAARL